jgi:hypothetical protein
VCDSADVPPVSGARRGGQGQWLTNFEVEAFLVPQPAGYEFDVAFLYRNIISRSDLIPQDMK